MENKAAIAVDRPADMHGVCCAEPGGADIQLLVKITKIKAVCPPVDDKSHRGFRVMMAHQDHGFLEPLVADIRTGDKKLALKRCHLASCIVVLFFPPAAGQLRRAA